MGLRFILFVVGGAALGFAYQRVVGCRTGTCPITSISTLYGAVMGYLLRKSPDRERSDRPIVNTQIGPS